MSFAWLKSVVLGSIGKLAGASLLAASLAVTACGDDPVKKGVATGCTLNSDCDGGLVCGFGLCHQQCKDSGDCPDQQTCVTTETANVCQLAEESECHFNSQCDDPLVCAIDQQCRNQCKADKDCLKGQQCADSVCADPKDVNADGGLKNAVGAGGGGNEPEACDPGADCVSADDPCKVGTISCAGGKMTCDVMGDADDGAECGSDKVCSSGKCVDCVMGEACQPEDGNSCLSGEMSCTHGPDCEVTGNVKAGTKCGSDKVCASGECVACVVGEACDPEGEPCKKGVLACSKGPVCNPTTSKDAGTECGTGKVCDSGAICQDCVQDGPCVPSDATCHTGTQDCKNGPICNDSELSAPDGGVCMGPGTYNFCKAGECAQCQTGNPCIPTNVCHTGTLQCETSPPTCMDTASNAVDGLACGDGKSCIGGACLTNDRTLTVTSGAVADVPIDAPFATVTVQLLDKNGAAVTGTAVTVAAPAGAYATATTTNPQGKSQISGRVGRALGSNKFTVSAPGATSIDFTVKGVAPTTGHILTYVNVNHLNGAPPTPAAGTISELYSAARAMTAAADGTLYIADYCAVYKLSLQGVLTRIAGQGSTSCGDTGDNGPGTAAALYTVFGLALDEANNYLFIAQQGYPRVRLLDLASGKLFAYAGSSTASNSAPWGDTQSATQAYVNPASLAVAPDGKLYISDQGSGHIRVVDAGGAIINSFASTGTCTAAAPLTFYSCAYYAGGCHFAWDKAGQMFLSATFCGEGQSAFAGIARVQVDANGQLAGLTRIAGTTTGSVPDDVTAINAQFTSAPAMAFDKAGNLYLTTVSANRVCRIDSLTDRIDTIAGTGEAGAFAGEYVAGTSAKLYNPDTLALDGNNNLYFADSANYAIRGLWNVGAVTAPTGALALTTGNNQTVKRDAPFASLVVKVTDAAAAVIPGVPVTWTRKETGSGLSGGASSVVQTTGLTGTSSMNGRVGLASGAYHFEASFTDIHGTAVEGSPQTFTITASDPTAGDIFAIVNFSHANGAATANAPAVFSQLQTGSYGIATASDGTIYLNDQCSVFKVSPRGEMTRFAGTGGCGFSGDTGLAVNATLYYPYALALDETRGVLYIADTSNSRIRAVTLASGKISTVAGGGSVATAPWGDGDDPTKANIGSPQSVSVGPDGKIYIPDSAHYPIRVIDPTATTVQIQPYITPTAGNGTCVNGVMSLYYATADTAVRFDSAGDPYVSGYFCEGATANLAYAIGKYNPANKTFTRVAGLYGGVAGDGLATNVHFDEIKDFIFDKNDNIYIAQTYSNTQDMLRRINHSDGQLVTVAGDGTAGYSKPGDLLPVPGDYEPATSVRVNNPFRLAIWSNGSLLFSDQGNYSVRMIW